MASTRGDHRDSVAPSAQVETTKQQKGNHRSSPAHPCTWMVSVPEWLDSEGKISGYKRLDPFFRVVTVCMSG